MKILHLYSDWKWTGPAEPALQACRALQDRGHDVVFACQEAAHEDRETIELKAAELDLDTTTRFCLDRHVPPLKTLRTLATLPRFIRREQFDIVHVHLCHDHAIGGICVRLLGSRRPRIVRSLYRRDVLQPTLGYRLQLRRLTDGWLTFTESFRREYVRRFALPDDRVGLQPMTVDADRFSPDRPPKDMRAALGIPAQAPVIGIVGRYQRYRRMEVFLEAARQVVDAEPQTRLLVIGRSSQMQQTVVEPMNRLGLADNVITPGYLIEDYADTLACLDVFSLLMPGFDGTARAVREAMALAKPCVVTDFGMLPEIIRHGETGLVVANEPQPLAQAWLTLIRDPERRQAMGAAARADALKRFACDRVGTCLEDFYASLLARPPGDPATPVQNH